MKNILLTAYNLEIGGIEKALINLLKNINYKKYNVTLILEEKKGVLLKQIPNEVSIIEYKISKCKIKLIRKIINRIKLIKTIIFNYNKYSFSCCYAPYSIPGSIIARYLSKNNSIWIHSDYYYLYNKDTVKINKFFNDRKIDKFKHIIFVSKDAKDNFDKIYSNLKYKTLVCNNLIDYKEVIKLSNEKTKEIKPNKTLFINVSRHEEKAKRITRIIEASRKLKEKDYNFEVWLIGSGEDTNLYIDMINKYKLSDNIKLLGFKENPYPYYKLADAYLLTSDYEGFPVVFLESLIMKLPIISTIDSLNINDYGILIKKDTNDVFKKMKIFIEREYKIKKEFNVEEYNSKASKIITNMIENKW